MSPTSVPALISPMRTLVVRIPDWSVIAAGVKATDPAAVIGANRVQATSPAARSEGVEVGQRRREAQRRCPSLLIIDPDPNRDAQAFASIAGVLDHFTPRIELSIPGTIAFPARGPSRYFGGDEMLASAIADAIDVELTSMGWSLAVGVGIADGPFAADIAATTAMHALGRVCVVPVGTSVEFLAPLPIAVLNFPELTEVLVRLGLRTVGSFAELTSDDVVARFGREGSDAHRLARVEDGVVPNVGPPPKHFDVTVELEPPAERVDVAAFAARKLADTLHDLLSAEGLACSRVVIAVETEHDELLERVWRAEGAMSSAAVAERVRWQLDGWLNGSAAQRPTSGIVRLTLIPEEVIAATGRQQGFWGGETEADERAGRALARVQGIVGATAVTVPEVRGGRSPADRVVRVVFTGTECRAVRHDAHAPWPGSIPNPVPALVVDDGVALMVMDAYGSVVTVSGRSLLSAEPDHVMVGGERGSRFAVAAWAGPWPSDERWWDRQTHRRRARLQLVFSDGRAVLVAIEQGRWSLEAVYD